MAKLAYTVAKGASLEPQNKDYQRGQILTLADAVTMILRCLNLSSLNLEHRTSQFTRRSLYL